MYHPTVDCSAIDDRAIIVDVEASRAIRQAEVGATRTIIRRTRDKFGLYLKRIMKLDRLRLRGPNGAKDEFNLAATAQNLRKLAKLIPMPA